MSNWLQILQTTKLRHSLVSDTSLAQHKSLHYNQRIALRIIYNDYNSDYNTLLDKSKQLKIHEINKRKLLIEVYKCLHKNNPSFLNDLFTEKSTQYNLRMSNLLKLPSTNTQSYGLKSITYRGSMIWNNLSDQLKTSTSIIQFKNALMKQEVIICTCHLCTWIYILIV